MKRRSSLLSFLFYSVVFFFFMMGVLVFFYYFGTQTANFWLSSLLMIFLSILFFRMLFLFFFSLIERWQYHPDVLEEKNIIIPEDQVMVSFLIPCFNEEKVIEQALNSIDGLYYKNIEIIVIDDGSIDQTSEKASQVHLKNKVQILRQKNQGKAQALNHGLSVAQGQYVFCMDADTLIQPKTLDIALKILHTDPTLAAIAGNVKVGNDDQMLTLLQRLEYLMGLNFPKLAQSFFGAVQIIPGPAGLFRKNLLLQVGGYRSHTFAEDYDLTLRLLMHGYHVRFCPEMVVITEAPDDIRSLVSQRYRWFRGVFQALRQFIPQLMTRRLPRRARRILYYTFFENYFIPLGNLFLILLSLIQAWNQDHVFIASLFSGFSLIDLLLIAYCVYEEKDALRLLGLSFLYRSTYGLFMEILRFLCWLDEFFNVPMSWGSLNRKGLKKKEDEVG